MESKLPATRRGSGVAPAQVVETGDIAGLGFRPGGEFTVGVEDELVLVDQDGGPSAVGCADVISRLDTRRLARASASPEVFAGQIEFATPVCADAFSVVEHLTDCRGALWAAGQAALAVGVHPTAKMGQCPPASSPRYDGIVEEFAGIFRTPTSAFQVHVGLPDTGALVAAYRGIRNRLALLRALSAGSPFWHGVDSGLASTRGAINRSYPRVGVPPRVRSYEEYEERVNLEIAAAEAPDYTHVWWDARPHPRLGTLEVRVMDAQCSLDYAAGLVALAQGLARHAVEEPSRADLPSCVLAENDFRAVRYGVDARLVDVDGHIKPARDIAIAAVGQARSALHAEGKDGALDALVFRLDHEQEYERQRRIRTVAGMRCLLTDLMTRTFDKPSVAGDQVVSKEAV
jgi:glutamate---cysteine ligase / carboxylate-amine ligase